MARYLPLATHTGALRWQANSATAAHATDAGSASAFPESGHWQQLAHPVTELSSQYQTVLAQEQAQALRQGFSADDVRFMTRALQLASLGQFSTSPNPNVGCVLVKDGQIVGEGFHQRAGFGHAEVHALAAAGDLARGATAYVTLEPCSHYGRTPPCALALVNAGVSRVIAAMVDPNPSVAGKGMALLADAGIATASGLLTESARALNGGFLSRMERRRPMLTVKMGHSLDGKTALANGESQWITSAQARLDVQWLRAQHCAILSGADTVLRDGARLTLRQTELPTPVVGYRPLVRIIIDSQARLSPDLAIFAEQDSASPVWLCRAATVPEACWLAELDAEAAELAIWPSHVKVLVVPSRQGKVDLSALLAFLATQQLNSVLVEAGATLVAALMQAQVVDSIISYVAPKLLGHASKGLVAGEPLSQLRDATQGEFIEIASVGPDIKLTMALGEK